MGNLWQDLRYAVRILVKSPVFTSTAVIVLALGIGANTAIFSVVDAVLLHRAPYHDPARLVAIGGRGPKGEADSISAGDFSDWEAQNQAFHGLVAYERWNFKVLVLTGAAEPDEVRVAQVTSNAFQELGVDAVRGRTFANDETLTIVLSHGYWRTRFKSDPKIVGKSLALDGKAYTVIGVAPPDFEFPDPNTQMWVPLTFSAAEKVDHENRWLSVIGRLKQGISASQAQAAMDLVARRLATQYPKTNAGWTTTVKPFKDRAISGVFRSALMALLGAAVFVLMIVCFNVTSMLFARGIARQGEMAVRAALGASRLRLLQQMVVETVLLAAAGSLFGIGLAVAGPTAIVALLPKYSLVETQALHRISINLPVLGFTAAISLLTGILMGLVPALRVWRLRLTESLKQSGRAARVGASGSRTQRVLVISQVAFALVLLVGAGLMIQSFRNLATAPTGFTPDHLLTVRVPLLNYKYSQGAQSAAFYSSVLQHIQAIPGVKAAGMANNLPFTGFHVSLALPAPLNSAGTPDSTFGAAGRSISPGYFEAMGIPFVAGRDFTEAENRPKAPCVRIVNQTMARIYWPGMNPIGRQLPGPCPNGTSASIIGVVADSKQDSVESKVLPELYEPYAQHPFASFLVTFAIRTATNPLDVAMVVRQAVQQIDGDQPVIQIRTMESVVSESIWLHRVIGSLLGIFATIALLLAAVGIYGVISYSISRRTHEFGIRSALGATRGDLLTLVLKQGLRLNVIGLTVGIILAMGLTRLLGGLLYGVRPYDPLTFVALSMLLSGVALIGTYIPARRASKVHPMVALRYE